MHCRCNSIVMAAGAEYQISYWSSHALVAWLAREIVQEKEVPASKSNKKIILILILYERETPSGFMPRYGHMTIKKYA